MAARGGNNNKNEKQNNNGNANGAWRVGYLAPKVLGIYDARLHLVARVGEDTAISFAQHVRNARLMRAAPLMRSAIAALQRARVLIPGGGAGSRPAKNAAIAQAIAALAASERDHDNGEG